MSEEINIDRNQDSGEIYRQLIPQINNLIDPDEPVITNLANISAALKQNLSKISWVGFYLLRSEKLYLGPFQGKTACTVIDLGKGVCGASAESRQTLVVPDVDKFPGHIACDDGSRSEIATPLIKGDELFGVLDLDSYNHSAFGAVDKKYLEIICTSLVNKLNLSEFKIN